MARLNNTLEIKLDWFFRVAKEMNRAIKFRGRQHEQHQARSGGADESNKGSESRRKNLPARNDRRPLFVEAMDECFLNHIVLKKAKAFGSVRSLFDRG